MTGDSSALAESPDRTAIGRVVRQINASLMPLGITPELTRVGVAPAPVLAAPVLVPAVLARVPSQLLSFVAHAKGVAARLSRGVRLSGVAACLAPAADDHGQGTGHWYLQSVDGSPDSRFGTCTPCLHLKDDRSATSLER